MTSFLGASQLGLYCPRLVKCYIINHCQQLGINATWKFLNSEVRKERVDISTSFFFQKTGHFGLLMVM